MGKRVVGGSVRLLDICSAAREFMSQLSKHASDLQSALLRRKGDSSMESRIATYTSFRRKMKKESKRLLAALKQMETKIGASSLINQDHRLEMMIRVLKEVSTRTISIFQAKGAIAQNRLEALEADIQVFENALGYMFRHLIKASSCLLNVFSH
ncbi:hypothetical protein RJ639_005184 [Escallonia herrerae]|uniref:Uncharacterized protein n=1 Tax=Escallonia herrerae TaxID=1293975 RepID=A0AA89AV42_9ASTE|nr:hypothetical protein RJ639_005184 [Escallonia herrerae]